MVDAPRPNTISQAEVDVAECVSRLLHLMRITADTARLLAGYADPDVALHLRTMAAQVEEMTETFAADIQSGINARRPS